MSETLRAITWLSDFEQAQTEARASKKPMLVDVYQVPCGGCEKLDQETFTDARVIEAISTRFVPVKLDLRASSPFARQWQVFWTPTSLFADRSGKVRYQFQNFLPADAYLDVLDVGEALIDMRWREYDHAIELLNNVVSRSPEGPMTAEAMYWRGITAYFRDNHSSASAKQEWQDLLEQFPDSIWAKRLP